MAVNLYSAINAKKSDDVSQEHVEYTLHKEQIGLVNDIYDGIDTAKEHLFQFPQELAATFQERKDRATLRNFVKRSSEAFVGMIFRKPIDISAYGPKVTALLPKINTIDTVQQFTRDCASAIIKDSKGYILADSPATDIAGAKPYLMLVKRNQLINWRTDANGKYTMIVIREIIAEEAGMFGTTYTEQFRVYNKRVDKEGNTTVTVTLWSKKDKPTKAEARKAANTGGYILTDTIKTEFDEIPFIEMSLQNVPILYDIAKMNIKHMNRQSHKDRYLTMAALPIPIIWGADIDEKTGVVSSAKPALVIGVDEAFIFTGTKQECDFEWRELSGESLQALEDDLNSIVEDITTGVIRAADSANAVQKTATEIQLLQAEASNRVTVIASIVELGMTRALELLAHLSLENVPSEATFLINKDFNSSLMGSDGARVVFEQYMTGLLSTETFLQSMADMELINIGSAADEIIRINDDKFKPKPRVEKPINNQDNRTKAVTE